MDVAAVMRAYRAALKEHRDAINRLNVYPVPDGDTGTNMSLTVESVVAELDALDGGGGAGGPHEAGRSDAGGASGAGGPHEAGGGAAQLTMAAVAKCMSHGSLMGARGNSGVILSQVLRGMSGAFQDAGELVSGPQFADALVRAADSAYAAVSNPVEGTILSVAGAAARGAEPVGHDTSLLATMQAARKAAAEALERTTEQLPALRAAGVVDAGGAGYLLLMESFLQVVDGTVPQAPPAPAQSSAAQLAGAQLPGAQQAGPAAANGAGGDLEERLVPDLAEVAEGEAGVADLRYEVMFFLEVPDESVPAFRALWATCGGSIVIVGGDGLYNCHIHTDNIGAAIEAAIEIGRPRQIRVSDLYEQVEEERWVREAEAAGTQEEPPAAPCTCAVVAVCAGEGVKRIFRSLGVSQIVAGGQSANPSTAQVLEAINAAPADQVVVLPNNPNVVAVAQQAVAASSKRARVVPTAGIPEGFAALLEYDPEADVDTNAENMTVAAKRVVAGEVAQAARQAATAAGTVNPGDWLGLDRSGVSVIAASPSSPADAAIALLDRLVQPDHEIVTIIEGEGAHAADSRRIVEWLSEHRPSVSAEVHHGGQPLYPYLFSIE